MVLLMREASAQRALRIMAEEAKRYVGKRVSVVDSVYGYKQIADHTYFYLGGNYPKQKLTVVIKGEAIANSDFIKQKIVRASGMITKKSRSLQLVVQNPESFVIERMVMTDDSIDISKVLSGRINPERPRLPLNELKEHIGEDVYLFGAVAGRRAVNDSLTYLYLEKAYPNHLLTVVIKGRQVNIDLAHLLLFSESLFSGDLILLAGKPTIIVTSKSQLSTQILL